MSRSQSPHSTARHGTERLGYGTDRVAPPGNQAANREHKQVPKVRRWKVSEKRGEQTRAEVRGAGR